MSNFQHFLKKIREERDMSQEQLAELLNTSKQNISRYERGEVTPKITTAARFAELLGVSLNELNGDEGVTDAPAVLDESAARREDVMRLLMALSVENQNKVLDYARLLLLSQQAESDSRV